MGTLIVNQYLNKLWTPSEITTALWLDAADSSTITTVSGTVSEWEDKKNNGLILTTPNPPLYNASLNNLNVISFVRTSNHYLRIASFPSTGWSNLLVFVVTKWTTINSDTTGNIQAIIDNYHNGNPQQGFVFQDRPDLSGDPLTYTRLPPISNGIQDNTNPGDNTWKMYCGYSSATFDRLYRDGEVVDEQANTEAFNFTNILNVGRTELHGGRYLNGDIAEIVITQDASSIGKVFGYLAHKWGLTANLPITHPYKNTPPYV